MTKLTNFLSISSFFIFICFLSLHLSNFLDEIFSLREISFCFCLRPKKSLLRVNVANSLPRHVVRDMSRDSPPTLPPTKERVKNVRLKANSMNVAGELIEWQRLTTERESVERETTEEDFIFKINIDKMYRIVTCHQIQCCFKAWTTWRVYVLIANGGFNAGQNVLCYAREWESHKIFEWDNWVKPLAARRGWLMHSILMDFHSFSMITSLERQRWWWRLRKNNGLEVPEER